MNLLKKQKNVKHFGICVKQKQQKSTKKKQNKTLNIFILSLKFIKELKL